MLLDSLNKNFCYNSLLKRVLQKFLTSFQVNHSYLLHCPQPPQPDPVASEPDFGEMFEPDVYVDDMAVRLVRDTNCHQHQVPPDPQPKFGIPLNGERVDVQVRRADYLHVKPDPQR